MIEKRVALLAAIGPPVREETLSREILNSKTTLALSLRQIKINLKRWEGIWVNYLMKFWGSSLPSNARAEVRDRVVLTPGAAGVKTSAWGVVPHLLADLVRRKHLQQ